MRRFVALLLFFLSWDTSALSAQMELVPNAGPPGGTVIITGQAFGSFRSAAENRVLFNGAPALVQRWEADYVEVKVPHQATDGTVSLMMGKEEVIAGIFSVQYPVIREVTPPEVEPGRVLQIAGGHFGDTAGSKDPNTMFGVNQVFVGGAKARVQKWRDDKIEVVVPARAKSGDIVVRLASSDPLPNGYCCAPVQYTVSNSVHVTVLPTIRADPLYGPVGTKIVLFGEGFGNQSGPERRLLLHGRPVTVAAWNDTSIVAHVPLGATSGPLSLELGERVRELGVFTVQSPKVKTLTPGQGPIGSMVRIRGEHFGMYTESGGTPFSFLDFDPGENRVTIGGARAIVYRWNDDLIDVWVPFSATGGPVVIHRGATVPHPDGSCCAERGELSIEAGTFTVATPTVESVTPTSAGIDEIVTIKGSGFGTLLKTREATDAALGSNAFQSKQMRLSENISRTEVLFNGVGAIVVSWTDSEIKVMVPRRPIYGIGTMTDFQADLSKGPLIVRRGSWDALPDGTCCTEKKWITIEAGEFTILAKGLPDQGFFNDPNTSYP